jgi:hypothetical protein
MPAATTILRTKRKARSWVVQAIEHDVDFLQFYVVPSMDFLEQPPSVLLCQRIFPVLVGDDLPLSGEVMKSPNDHLAALYEPVAAMNVSSVSVKAHATPPRN